MAWSWNQVTNVPCMFKRCNGTLRWAENGYVPGYRICDRCGNHFQLTRLGKLRPNWRRNRILGNGHVDFNFIRGGR
jgi:hypothetical protein